MWIVTHSSAGFRWLNLTREGDGLRSVLGSHVAELDAEELGDFSLDVFNC
jgi:hypothetical protein